MVQYMAYPDSHAQVYQRVRDSAKAPWKALPEISERRKGTAERHPAGLGDLYNTTLPLVPEKPESRKTLEFFNKVRIRFYDLLLDL